MMCSGYHPQSQISSDPQSENRPLSYLTFIRGEARSHTYRYGEQVSFAECHLKNKSISKTSGEQSKSSNPLQETTGNVDLYLYLSTIGILIEKKIANQNPYNDRRHMYRVVATAGVGVTSLLLSVNAGVGSVHKMSATLDVRKNPCGGR